MVHINVVHVETPIARHNHDLGAVAAHGHDTAGRRTTAAAGYTGNLRRRIRLGDLYKGKVAGGLPHLRDGLGKVRAHDAGDAAAHDLRGAAQHVAERATLPTVTRCSMAGSVVAARGQLCGVASGGLGGAVPRRLSVVVGARPGPSILSRGTGRLDRCAAGGGIVRRGSEAEDVDGVRGGGDAEEGGAEVEGHAVYSGGIGASPELVELLTPRDREDADDGAGFAGGGQQSTVVVQAHAAEGCSVGFYHVDRLESNGIEDQYPAGCGRHIWGLRWCVGWSPGVGLLARLGEWVGEVAVLGGWGQGADGIGVGGGVDGVDEAHVADVVEVDLLLEDDGESFAVQSDGEDGGGEGEFADDGGALPKGVSGEHEGRMEGWRSRTFVFCITRWRGVMVTATREVEKSISMMAVLPSSLLNIREKGSVW